MGLIGNYLLGGVVLHGNLQVKWRPTHIPQQNFQFWWICGFGAYWELFARGGLFYMEIYRSNGGRPTFHSKIFNFGGFAGLGLIGNYLLGGVVLHGNLQVKWRPTHIPQQNFQFGGFAGLGLIGNYLLGGVVLHGNLQVKWKSNHVLASGFCSFGGFAVGLVVLSRCLRVGSGGLARLLFLSFFVFHSKHYSKYHFTFFIFQLFITVCQSLGEATTVPESEFGSPVSSRDC